MLYIIATPIGNLEDISLRALRLLNQADYILCEDTRVTKKLLNHYNIDSELISYHQHSNEYKIDNILNLLKEGKSLALVSDAGTPGISDPGGKLVQRVVEIQNSRENKEDKRFNIESIPGPSAITAALSISGLPTDKFIFMGFPPHKKGRLTFINKILLSEYPVVVYESKHRIIKFLEEIKKNHELELQNYEVVKSDKNAIKPKDLTSVVVLRELTKMHETTYRGELVNIITKIKNDPNAQKGEFVIIIGK